MLDLQTPPARKLPSLPRPRHSPVAEPWKRSWTYRAPGETMTFAWIALLHGLGVVGLFFAFPVPWPALAVALALLVLGGLGTTVAYHRALAHRAVKLNPVVEHVLVFFAMLNGSGTPRTWVANHRLHHGTSDSEEDISSPAQGGFWWAHLRWLWQAGQAPLARYAPDLDTPAHRFWTRMHVPILALSLFGGLAFGLAAWVWIGPLRLLWALHAQCAVNSICHTGDPEGAGGSSRNVWWLSPFLLLQGEQWHRNHHDRPADARLGYGFRQVDLGWWTISALRRLGLARKIRRPSIAPAHRSAG